VELKCLLIIIRGKSSGFIDLEILNQNTMKGNPLESASHEPYLHLCVFNGILHWSFMTSIKSSGKPDVPLAFSCTEKSNSLLTVISDASA